MSLLIGNICFAWTGDYEALKTFVASDLKLNGNWEQPGGDKKVFYFNNNSIAWRRNKGLLPTLIITQSRGEGIKAFYKSRVMKWVT